MVTNAYLKDWQKKRMKNRFEVFMINNGFAGGRNQTREILVKSAALAYGVPKAILNEENILTGEKGKPYFEKLDTHFSISHSDDLWACLMGPFRCGLDVQYIKPCNFEKIAGRFFSAEEAEYVKKHGINGFFTLWTRREAYCKYTGEGFFSDVPALVDRCGNLRQTVTTWENIEVEFVEIHLADGVKCTACIEQDRDKTIEIRKDWNYEDYISIR